ncbi:MAG: hypothetical protein O3C27_06825 [Actinomycetota bacterium]|nr:hypothetical protein [Actinomycetota bacterium]
MTASDERLEPTDLEPTDLEPTDPEPTDPEPTDPEQTDPGVVPSRTFAGGTMIEGWTGWSPGKVIMVGLLAASFGLWVYAYSGFADRRAPDTLDDPSFAVAAEPICAEAKARYDELPGSLQAVDHHARADQIRTANAVLDDMLTALEREAVVMAGTERDRGIITLWLGRWRILLSDRAGYADRLDIDPAALFFISEAAGFRAEKSIDYVANTNRMPSCSLPGDVG